MTSVVALIPARAGSKRLPGKNQKVLNGHPLVAYTIAAATQSGVFDRVLVCSDAKAIIEIAHKYGAETLHRSASLDDEADIEWVQEALHELQDPPYDAFAILRPTSPFRSAETIRWAWEWFRRARDFDSLRAVAPAGQHPGKMWTVHDDGHLRALRPVLLQPAQGTPWHSSPTQSLPKVWAQTGGLEIAWTDVVRSTGTISGSRILALELEWPEAQDINTLQDWWVAERAIHDGLATLPEIPEK